MSRTLWVVTCASGTQWLVRAANAAQAQERWPDDADPILRVDPLRGDRARAAYLREMGQADLGA